MRYTDELLESLRSVGDPIPDRLIAELDQSGKTDAVNAVLATLRRDTEPVAGSLPPDLEVFLRENTSLPPDADRARLDRASDFFVERGIPACLVLALSSLVECYSAKKGAKTLSCSYRLLWDPYRRVGETGQFLLNVMAPGGLEPNGQGLWTIRKVRLMHSSIRHLIRQTGTFDEALLGVPINQEDMLGTLMAFASNLIVGLGKLGFSVDDRAAEDYLYRWRVIGQILGVRPDILPNNLAEGNEAFANILRRQQGPSPEGAMLTKALIEMEEKMLLNPLLSGVIPAMVRVMAGDQVADWLEVPRTGWQLLAEHGSDMGRLVDKLEGHSHPLTQLAGELGLRILQAQAFVMEGYRFAGFQIPTTLREPWQARGLALR